MTKQKHYSSDYFVDFFSLLREIANLFFLQHLYGIDPSPGPHCSLSPVSVEKTKTRVCFTRLTVNFPEGERPSNCFTTFSFSHSCARDYTFLLHLLLFTPSPVCLSVYMAACLIVCPSVSVFFFSHERLSVFVGTE